MSDQPSDEQIQPTSDQPVEPPKRPRVTRPRVTASAPPPRARRAPTGPAASGEPVEEPPATGTAASASFQAPSSGEQEHLRLERSAVERLEARDVDVRIGAVGRAEADEIVLSMGAIGGARADRVTVEMGALGGAVAREVRVSQSFVNGIVGQEVSLEQSAARSIVAGKVTMGPASGAFIVLAGRVEGEARSVLDWRAGLALVSAFVVAWWALRFGRRRG